MATYTAEDILRKLDADAANLHFPMLDNGYVYPADARLLAYRDETRWAILIETLGYSYKAMFPHGIDSTVYAAGNGARRESVYMSCASPVSCEFDEDGEFDCDVPPDLKEILIRGVPVPIPRERAAYRAKEITLRTRSTKVRDLWGDELLRVLLPEHREALLGTKEEIAQFVWPDLPFFLGLDAWDHPDLADEELPSDTDTFPALAEALVHGDPNRFHPSRKPNTHWKNWPQGGTL